MYNLNSDVDVVIVGGGMSGLSAALLLGRSNVNVIIISETNVSSHETHNFLTRDGVSKNNLQRLAEVDVEKYPTVRILRSHAIDAQKRPRGFRVALENKEEITCDFLVISSGISIDDPLFKITGATDIWAKTMFTCPYCHGYEFNQKKFTVLNGGKNSVSFIKTLSQWTSKINYITNGDPFPPEIAQTISILDDYNQIYDGLISEFKHIDGNLTEVCLHDGQTIKTDVAFIGDLSFSDNAIANSLNVEKTVNSQTGKMMYKSDPMGRTNVTDLFMIGDVRTSFSTLSGAAYEGILAGSFIVNTVVQKRFEKLQNKAERKLFSYAR